MVATKATDKAPQGRAQEVRITAPNIREAVFEIHGTAPYVQLRFSAKAQKQMADKMAAGSQAKKGKKREPRDFDDDYQQAMHVSQEGWHGIPASAFRNALIDACRLVDFKMTLAKLSIFVKAEGFDKIDGLPLIRIYGEPEKTEMHVRNETGVADIRVRPMWRTWNASLHVRYDEDQFSLADVTNLLHRVGEQVGIGEGRHNSKKSTGLGWGTFTIVAG